MQQLTHNTTNFKKRTFPITLVCDGIINAPNIGSLFRVTDAFGVEKLIFCGTDNVIGKRMKKTSRSTEKYVNYTVEANIEDVVIQLKNTHHLMALEITENSLPLGSYKLQVNKPLALIIGNENFGISETILNQCHTKIHINMYGNNSSMNVVQATSIMLYELSKQFNLNQANSSN